MNPDAMNPLVTELKDAALEYLEDPADSEQGVILAYEAIYLLGELLKAPEATVAIAEQTEALIEKMRNANEDW